MEYSINKLTKMSGVSTRTLRYYDEIGLLKPLRVAESGYRIYGQAQVDDLQQIMFYRELGFALEDIRKLLSAPDFDRARAYESHLSALSEQRERLDVLIENVKKSLSALKGEITMADKDKFEGFKKKLIEDNEQEYGAEIRSKYGDDAIDVSNAHLKGLSKEKFEEGEHLRVQIDEVLKAAFEIGDPSGKLAQKACDLPDNGFAYAVPSIASRITKG